MKDTELVSALRQLKINTKGLDCIGCNYGFNCHASGCRLIGIAADRLNEIGIILSIIKGMYAEAKDSDKTLLGIVLPCSTGITVLLMASLAILRLRKRTYTKWSMTSKYVRRKLIWLRRLTISTEISGS